MSIVNDHAAIKREKESYLPLPTARKATQKEISTVQQLIKQDVQDIVDVVFEEVMNHAGEAGIGGGEEGVGFRDASYR